MEKIIGVEEKVFPGTNYFTEPAQAKIKIIAFKVGFQLRFHACMYLDR
jgi:hypothetical protein